MPTNVTANPVQPGETRTIDEAIAFGRETWQALWRPFSRQWSQPALIKLAAATLKVRALHSSQIHGWNTGKLKDPFPQADVGRRQTPEFGYRQAATALMLMPPRCPGDLEKLWKGFRIG